MKKRALALYKPPFSCIETMIFDADNNHVADVRGWGRIQYKEHPEALQDTIGECVVDALNAHWRSEGE